LPIGLALEFPHLPFHSARNAEQGDKKIKNDLIDTVGYYGPDDNADHNIIKVAIRGFKLVKDLQKACRGTANHRVAHPMGEPPSLKNWFWNYYAIYRNFDAAKR
jgi:hypothetical protein